MIDKYDELLINNHSIIEEHKKKSMSIYSVIVKSFTNKQTKAKMVSECPFKVNAIKYNKSKFLLKVNKVQLIFFLLWEQ